MNTYQTLERNKKLQLFIALPLFILFKFLGTFLTYHMSQWSSGFSESFLKYIIIPVTFIGLMIVFIFCYSTLLEGGYNFWSRCLLIILAACSMSVARFYFYNERYWLEIVAESLVVLIMIRRAWKKQIHNLQVMMEGYNKIAAHDPELAKMLLESSLNVDEKNKNNREE